MDYGVKETLPKNPREKANFISKIFFFWLTPLFFKGTKKDLEINDVYNTFSKDKSKELGDKLERHYNAEINKINSKLSKSADKKDSKERPQPSLFKCLLKTLWVDFLYLGILGFFNEIIIKLSMPIFLGKLLNYFKPEPQVTYTEALWYAGGLVFLNTAGALCMNHYILDGYLLGMKGRVAVCSLIYRKSLRLSRTALGESAPGKVVNLLSNDVNRFDISGMFIHYLWLAPLASIIAMYFIWMEIGVCGLFGVLIVFTAMPIQAYTGKLSAKFRLQTALKTDERVRFMGEIVSGVQVIKMYVWEKPFQKLINWARRLEIKAVRKTSYVRAIFMTFMLSTTRIGVFFVMFSMILFNYNITVEQMFVVSLYFQILAAVLSSFFVRAIAEIAESVVAIKRLQKYLSHHEFKENEPQIITNGIPKDTKPDLSMVSLNNIKARWDDAETTPTMEINDFYVKRGTLMGVIGPVGSGKSSLLQMILKEMPISYGNVGLNGTIAYACQEPWIFGASVRQNILFGDKYDKKRYEDVIYACALKKDLEQFPHGDKTIVGERGASLSGGQKARINLARAVYRKADIYLMDDPLSAVDAHVGKHLFEKCIMGFLKHKTRILVTHQLHYLKDADRIVLLQDGKIELADTFEGFCNSSNDYAQLMIMEEKDEPKDQDLETVLELENTKKHLRKRDRKSNSFSSHRERSVSVSSSILDVDEITHPSPEDEEQGPKAIAEASSKSAVKGSKILMYLTSGTHIAVLLFVALTFFLTQILVSAADFWMSYWTSQEELRNFYSANMNSTTATQEEIEKWQTLNDGLLDSKTCIIIHGSIVGLLLVVSMYRAIEFYNVCMRSSQALHDQMFRGIIRASMRFFNTNPSGRILNRFSKDIGNMDEWLPKSILDASQSILVIVGVLCLVAIVNPIFLVPTLLIGILFLLMRKYYLKTSKDLKRLEGIHRSPVFTHLNATLQGLPTIRSFGTQDLLKLEFDEYQDIHTATWSLYVISGTAFGLVLDVVCMLLFAIVTFTFLLFDTGIEGSAVGLTITQVMSLSLILQWGIRQSAEVANQLMAVERILEYTFLPPENGVEPDEVDIKKKTEVTKQILAKPPRDWPEFGKIQFKDLRLKYSEDNSEPYVLKGLNCVFQSKEKIGIVGRTGAGKSSLIAALFRLAFNEGSVLIDNVETHTISLENLRKKISIIPQDPVLFSGTLRRNLDPFEEYSDQDIWSALEKVELKEALSGPAGLEMKVADEGSNFSVGQRQLVCLARAILRDNRILMLDEATANVDPYTDNLIQKTIRDKFANCTVLTIAHRLNTIMDSDKVLVMDHGQIVEFDLPYKLLQNKDGFLYKMTQETGKENAEILLTAAKEHYESYLSKGLPSYEDIKMIDE